MLQSRPKISKTDENGAGGVPSERRRTQRFRVHWAVHVKGIDANGRILDETGLLENLSSTGALIVLPTGALPGARLSVRIKIPLKKREYIGYSARVKRVGESGRLTAIALVFETHRPTFASS